MNARDELFQDLTQWCTTEESLELMNAYRAEVLREAADKIRQLRDDCRYAPDSVEYRHLTGAAELIEGRKR